MATGEGKFGLSSRALVFAPLAVLTLIFGTIVTMSLTNVFGDSNSRNLLLAGSAIYALAVLGFVRIGLINVRELERLGLRDSLTNLPNRRAIHVEMARNSRPGEERAMALLNLDGFKFVNDHYGHFVGDKLIKQCAKLFTEVCDKEARCYRLGGDEFVFAKTGPLSGTILEGICRSVIEALDKPMSVDDRRISLGASIGLARGDGLDGVDSSEMLRRCDVASLASKRGGKMRCTWFNEAFDRSRDAIRQLDEELRLALAEGQFILHYQPLVDARTREVVSVESLMRWNRPDGKSIGPNIFIPIAEESGLINAIGLWVLRQACTDALAWDGITLSVNISAAQLRNPEFPIHLGDILEETGFPADRLELEITETSLVLDPAVAERSLDVIRDFGVNVALDDFGTGYASIGFLRQFRFEKLKLDRSLVVQAGEDDGSRAMMLSSITVARAMKMDVTAEGVETQEQADMVRAAGCDQIQGWLYFKAMPPEEIAQYLSGPAIPAADRSEISRKKSA
ncbi:putative bifunctional diguanylate cyclase/phosphodiesterase [Altererythrobacter sp. MF3-039]|uniref:putative bifunctional diguanylate cyclase/phosphodiesterase n=1 Tax=Altererythrobacter sp. MF3-039 TaxID=3252901 RepID=UPI00390CCBCE